MALVAPVPPASSSVSPHPSDADYRSAAAVLSTERAPGDVVLLHPWWTERARLFVPPQIPVVGYLGDTSDDLIAHPRIWVLANERLPFVPDADFRTRLLPDRTPLGPSRRFGPLTLTAYRNGRARTVHFSAADPLAQAEVSIESPGAAPAPCPRSGESFACRAGRAEVAWHEVLSQPVRCLFLVPPGGPARIAVRFPEAPAGTLLLEAGITWEHAWKRERSDVQLALSGPGGVLHLRIPQAHEGFVSGDAPIPAAGPVTLTVQADDPHEREVCVRLRVLGAAVSRARTAPTAASPSAWAWSPSPCSGRRAAGGLRPRRGVYFAAAEQFARWWALLFHQPSLALSDRVISQAFDFNHEHPMAMKMLFGWSHALFAQTLHWVRPAAGFRLPAFAVAALIPALLHLWGSTLWGRRAGLFAALSFFAVPRHFFHAHLSCFDMPVAAMWLLVVYLFWRAEEDLRLAPWTGLALGLAMATKHNAFFLPVVLTPFGVLAAWRVASPETRKLLVRMGQVALAAAVYAGLLVLVKGREGTVRSWELLSPQTFGVLALVATLAAIALRIARTDRAAFVPLAPLVAMGLLGPLVFYVHWPYLWYHPVDRLAWYLDFHATHVHYAWTYFDQVLRAPPFPLAYVFVITALTLPVSLLLPMAVGLVRTWLRNLGDLLPALARRFGRGGSTEWLLGVNALFSILLISLPDVPHFGGVKHWLPSMPFLALLGAREVDRAVAALPRALGLAERRVNALAVALGALLLLPALTATAHVHPYGTSAYGELAGGIPGAASLGLQRQYWSNNVTGVLP
jgi:hypothetical protein